MPSETPGQKYRREKAEAAAAAEAVRYASDPRRNVEKRAAQEGNRRANNAIRTLDECEKLPRHEREPCIRAAYHAGISGTGTRSSYAPPHTWRRLLGGSRKMHARRKAKRSTRKQRGGLFGSESKLLEAVKAGRLTTEGKGNKDSVLELLGPALSTYGGIEYFTEQKFLEYETKSKFTEEDLGNYLRKIDNMSEEGKKRLSEWLDEKIFRHSIRTSTILSPKTMIGRIITHILNFTMKWATNPARGIEPPPSTPVGSVETFNPLHRAKSLPTGWKEVIDPEDGARYYISPTGKSQWEHP